MEMTFKKLQKTRCSRDIEKYYSSFKTLRLKSMNFKSLSRNGIKRFIHSINSGGKTRFHHFALIWLTLDRERRKKKVLLCGCSESPKIITYIWDARICLDRLQVSVLLFNRFLLCVFFARREQARTITKEPFNIFQNICEEKTFSFN